MEEAETNLNNNPSMRFKLGAEVDPSGQIQPEYIKGPNVSTKFNTAYLNALLIDYALFSYGDSNELPTRWPRHPGICTVEGPGWPSTFTNNVILTDADSALRLTKLASGISNNKSAFQRNSSEYEKVDVFQDQGAEHIQLDAEGFLRDTYKRLIRFSSFITYASNVSI
jgi:hypothetical protein